MPRFYVDLPLDVNITLDVPETVMRHIHVLRLKEENEIVLFNGRGGEYLAKIQSIEKKRVSCQIYKFDDIERESPLFLGLAQAISSGDRMEFTLQKGVEMGVNVFQPIESERSIVRLSAERKEKRLLRWQEVVISACEQSGRNQIPQVLPILSLGEYLNRLNPNEKHYLLSPIGNKKLGDYSQFLGRTWILAGPEGGLSAKEEKLALEKGYEALCLGPRILRTETAALSAVSAMQTLWGDY